MVEDTIRLLLVDDDARQARKVEALLGEIRGEHYAVEFATNGGAALDALCRDDHHDVGLVSLRSVGLQGLRDAVARGCQTPIILLAGPEWRVDIWTRTAGVADCLPEGSLRSDVLERTIRYTIDRHRMTGAIRESEARRRAILVTAIDAIVSIDVDGRITEFNPAAELMFGWQRAAILGEAMVATIVPVSLREAHSAGFARHLRTGASTLLGHRIETTGLRSDGTEFPIELTIVRIDVEGHTGFIAYIRDTTDRKAAELALQLSETRYRELVQHAAYGIYQSTADGRFVSANPALVAMLGYASEEELLSLDIVRDVYVTPSDRAVTVSDLLSPHRRSLDVEVAWRRKDDRHITVRLTGQPVFSDGRLRHFDMFVEDVTERRALEQQLVQSQKFDTVGRLAGGIAHDFNNLLTAILGYSELLLDEFAPGHPHRGDLDEIHKAAQRAAALTHQLLAFSRKQVLQPISMDLNAALAGVTALLKRLIGENIEIVLSLDPEASPITADPGQIEQVVVNLAVNGRDAMPQGGTLTIATRNVVLDEHFARGHIGAKAGPHVMLAITDTGTGMTPEVVAHLFEPFFTTKARDKGTGLGLATVYGIVKQSGGSIWASSEINRGTTFTAYLPPSSQPVSPVVLEQTPSTIPRGAGQTILLVEDDDGVRALTLNVLIRLGYRVLSAGCGDEALGIARRTTEPIDLLLTDVVMPDMGGRDLVARFARVRPGVKVLFMSGYTDDAILQHGVLDEGTAFLHKPFTHERLSAAVRSALDVNA